MEDKTMRLISAKMIALAALILGRGAYVNAIQPIVSGAEQGESPAELAQRIAGSGVDVQTMSVSVEINDSANNFPATFFNSFGHFISGNTASGTSLPSVNGGPTATYAGGIDIDTGVCLCTGLLTDGVQEPPARGIGVEGPNNGTSSSATNEGEISLVALAPSTAPLQDVGKDEDFVLAVFGHLDEGARPGGGDAAVLEFGIDIDSPGFLRISFVFGSDEAPFFLDQPFNDSFAVIIDGENIATITKVVDNEIMTIPFTLQDMASCPLLYSKNDVAPEPDQLDGSEHGTLGASLYDIEFGGFTKKLTRETKYPLAPGTHLVKIVIQDVADRRLDSALFVETDSLRQFPLRQGDYNGDGIVDTADYEVWRAHFGVSPATFYDGDGNGNGTVDAADYGYWQDNIGQTGNRDWKADFDRSGCVTITDLNILSSNFSQLLKCASRFEGDATGDGAVTLADLNQLATEFNQGCGGAAMMEGGAADDLELTAQLAELNADEDVLTQFRSALKTAVEEAERMAITYIAPIVKSLIPEKADANNDGHVDDADFAIIDEALGLK
jgi:hypothetical protein